MTTTGRKLAKHGAIVLATVLGVAILATGGLALWLYNADLKPIFERHASDELQRRVSIGKLTVGWGDPLAIEFGDLRIANASWGSAPDMVRIGHLSALLDLPSLLRGVLRYENLRIEDATIHLERDPAGAGNWEFGGDGLGGTLAIVPKNREQFPTLIDFALARGLVAYRTSSGQILRIALDRVLARTDGETAPIALHGEGAYNDVAATFDALTQSATLLREAGKPFGVEFTLAGDDATIAFDGTTMEPLDFDGVRGPLTLEARSLYGLLTVLGADAKANLPFALAGALTREGDDWSLAEAAGKLGDDAFAGTLALTEGGRGEADDFTVDLGMKTIDIDRLVSAFGYGKIDPDIATLPLQLDLTAFNLTALWSSDQVKLAALRLSDVHVDGRIAGGDVSVRALAFALAGGTLTAAGSLEQTEASGHLALTAFLTKAEADRLAQSIGADGGEIRGRLDGGATLELTGKTLGAALATGRGAAIMTMADGDVARELIELVSADLRTLFRSGEGRVPVGCLLGVLTLRDGIGVISPLRLDSQEATLVGAGTIDFLGQRLDLKLKTERDSTGFFALDVPILVSGPFKGLAAKPLPGADGPWLDEAAGKAAVEALPAALHKLARESACGG